MPEPSNRPEAIERRVTIRLNQLLPVPLPAPRPTAETLEESVPATEAQAAEPLVIEGSVEPLPAAEVPVAAAPVAAVETTDPIAVEPADTAAVEAAGPAAVEQVEAAAAVETAPAEPSAVPEPEAGMAVPAAAAAAAVAAPAAQVAANTVLAPRPAASVRADMIVVNKSARLMHLLHGRQIIRTYRIALGGDPTGHKQYQGDERTPEGVYLIDGRNPNSDFHLSLHISYPRSVDNWYAAAQGNDAGSMIMIHGLPNGWTAEQVGHPNQDWTNGCIAVTNEEIEEIWSLVDDGTTIRIFP